MTLSAEPRSLISTTFQRSVSCVLMFAALLLAFTWAGPAQAQSYTVLCSFNLDHGVEPLAGVFRDSAGDLYGTTVYGGALGSGTVFTLNTAGIETVLHSFTGDLDAGNPFAALIRDTSGNFYGTAYGGVSNAGVVFKMDQSGVLTPLHSFTDFKSGAGLTARVVRDQAGNLYSTAEAGGNARLCPLAGCGVVFKVDPSGNETVLYRFKGKDGKTPFSGVIRDQMGNLYGTTKSGGTSGAGVVFQLRGGKLTVLYSFKGTSDGNTPVAGLIRDSAGNFYGTTEYGGKSGAGVIFKLDPHGNETVLYSFTGGSDGANPVASLIMDTAGNLYGTALNGGTSNNGAVFKLDTAGKETVLHSFNGNDGASPGSELIRDSNGNFYGTTGYGGAFGHGVVFKLTP